MRTLLLLAGLSIAGVASASTTDLGPIAKGVPTSFAELNLPGAFNDVFSFSLTDKAEFGIGVTNFEPFSNLHTVLLGLALVSNPDGKLFNGDDKLLKVGVPVGNALALTAWGLQPGNYYVDVVGIATGANGGVYQGTVLSAVPEPETYALMLAGMAMVGFLTHRRRNQD
jgi:hypothetical protein